MMDGLSAIPDRLLSLSAGHLRIVLDEDDKVREKSKVEGLGVGLWFIKAS